MAFLHHGGYFTKTLADESHQKIVIFHKTIENCEKMHRMNFRRNIPTVQNAFYSMWVLDRREDYVRSSCDNAQHDCRRTAWWIHKRRGCCQKFRNRHIWAADRHTIHERRTCNDPPRCSKNPLTVSDLVKVKGMHRDPLRALIEHQWIAFEKNRKYVRKWIYLKN